MITFANLTKRYGRVLALDNVSFTVEAGTITGFLGPNGAGKSTAMRCLVGLSRPDSGAATVGGENYTTLGNPAAHVGVLLDAAAQHASRSGLECLKLAAMVVGAPNERVDEMLRVVGLTHHEAKRKVGGYSLGMRQRLGIAIALLGSPQVLVLDEPANGLDPQGIHWMRNLLRGFADAGGTVLLSSHLLHEVEQIADRIVMIGNGRIVAEGTIAELTADGSSLEDVYLNLSNSTSREGLAA